MKTAIGSVVVLAMGTLAWVARAEPPTAGPDLLAGTQRLTWQGDLAMRMLAGVDRFLAAETARSLASRKGRWHRRLDGPAAYERSVADNRRRLAHLLGLRDARVEGPRPVPVGVRILQQGRGEADGVKGGPPTGRAQARDHCGEIARTDRYRVLAIRWPTVRDVHAEGLLLEPLGQPSGPAMDLIAIPDASQTPEQLVGLEPGIPITSQFARRFAEAGCRVVIPALVGRTAHYRAPPGRPQPRLSDREFLYRGAYEMGRHVIGYELHAVMAAVDYLQQARPRARPPAAADRPLGVMGYGDGGMIALYAAAVDRRIDAACVSGYFGPREALWREPIDRNLFGLLAEFGDAEVASLIAPRVLTVEAAAGPEFTLSGEGNGAPGRCETPRLADVRAEAARAQQWVDGLGDAPLVRVLACGDGRGPFGTRSPQAYFPSLPFGRYPPAGRASAEEAPPGKPDRADHRAEGVAPPPSKRPPDAVLADPAADRQRISARAQRIVYEIDRDIQRLLVESPAVRREFFAKVDTSDLQRFERSIAPYRRYFGDRIIGRFDRPMLPPNPRTRRVFDRPKWTGYQVVLDVWPDVFAYGLLLVPKDVRAGERRPVVVCQHGLEGRPRDVVAGDARAVATYGNFAARLAEQGFVTFAPQNLYLGGDRFRVLQRKANPLGKTLFSIIVPQHRQIVRWLGSLPFVDPNRIAFYGLSYGGKSAMRIPPLVEEYCLSICSADFNDWIWKNVSTQSRYSYVFTGEYEMFEFDLGNTFGYAEMAALIAPRPFMVERGHFDGVAPDERVAYEFAKVRHLYAARLGIGDRCRIEWFAGPHSIHGVGTFDFLHRQLRWPKR